MIGLLGTHQLVFQSCSDVGGGVTSFAFSAKQPFKVKAGQHCLLKLSGFARKPFSIASAPEEENVQIGTSLLSGSSFKRRLAALQPGDEVSIRGPLNRFTFDGVEERVVMLAQGVGITPLRSMLAHVAMTQLGIETHLVHVAQGGHAYRTETERWATSAAYLEHSLQFRGIAADLACHHPNAIFFIAGAPPFVSSTSSMLLKLDIASSNIRKDKYLGYKPDPRG
jgi:ferredoxin-NADP reductase